jgi:hypothetical protein
MTIRAPATSMSGCIRGRLSARRTQPSSKQSHLDIHLPLSELEALPSFSGLCSSLARHCDDRDRTLELAFHLVR